IEKEMLREPGSSVVFDKRFNEARDIPDLLDKARANGKTVKIVDLDAPLELSAARVLTRNANGDAPLVPFAAVEDGFNGIRKDGHGGIANGPLVKDYELYVVNGEGKPVRVAYKQDGVWHDPEPKNMDLFRQAVDPDTSMDVEKSRDQKIDDAFIEKMVRTAP